MFKYAATYAAMLKLANTLYVLMDATRLGVPGTQNQLLWSLASGAIEGTFPIASRLGYLTYMTMCQRLPMKPL